VKFLSGVLIGLTVGVLAAWPDAGPSPRAPTARAIARRSGPVHRAATVAAPARSEPRIPVRAPQASAARGSNRTRLRIAALLESTSYVDALRAADLLAREGRDVSHLGWAFDEAVFRIDRHRAGEPGSEVIEALKAVCRNRVAWRREALDAARALAARSHHEVAVCARDTVEHLSSRMVLSANR